MHIREIHLRNFMSHANTRVELPERGVVVVGGPNGGGKTGLFREAPAMAAWGERFRPTPWWPWAGDEAGVRIVTGTHDIARKKIKTAAPVLTWHRVGDTDPGRGTTTKAQVLLETEIRGFDLWKRTSVLSLDEASGFLAGTDAQRKAIFESICGLEAFDIALEKCRVDIKAARAAVLTSEGKLGVLQERIRGATTRIADLRESAAAETTVARPLIAAAVLETAREALVEAGDAITAAEREGRKVTAETAQAEAELGLAEQQCKRLDKDTCPTCAQPIPRTLRVSLHDAVLAARAHCEALRASVRDRARGLRKTIDAARTEQEDLKALLARGAAGSRDAEQHAAAETRRATKLAESTRELEASVIEVTGLQARLQVLRADLAELEVIERVLGLKGVRVALMNRAIATVTHLTNKWLSHLFPGITVRLYEEKTKICLEVTGLPHAYGYAGASSGQRRRLDVALMFALSDFVALTFGDTRGTLILDEVADTLDEDGLAAFSETIAAIAQERCVVLITHNKTLLQGIRAAKRLSVVAGKVTES